MKPILSLELKHGDESYVSSVVGLPGHPRWLGYWARLEWRDLIIGRTQCWRGHAGLANSPRATNMRLITGVPSLLMFCSTSAI